MSVSIEDLKPKNFTITVKGVELNCRPLKLSQALLVSKVGAVFQNTQEATRDQITQAEKDLYEVIGETIPDLKGVELDMSVLMDVITQLSESITPSDNKELKERGVKFDADPKAEMTG